MLWRNDHLSRPVPKAHSQYSKYVEWTETSSHNYQAIPSFPQYKEFQNFTIIMSICTVVHLYLSSLNNEMQKKNNA